ncbi:hypothetical protein [Desulfofalx alkaliphila]|uniref:hypothetical protein n=1 Tax=Desulfofalx alkaliphila TaxID=105483 RepID=UPI0004E1989B|nr:hypothetical protein [Desulfofalx alkaliphila]
MSKKNHDFLPEDLEEVQEVMELISEDLEDTFDDPAENLHLLVNEDLEINSHGDEDDIEYDIEQYQVEEDQTDSDLCCEDAEVLDTLSEMLDQLIGEQDGLEMAEEEPEPEQSYSRGWQREIEDEMEKDLEKELEKELLKVSGAAYKAKKDRERWHEDLVIDEYDESEDGLVTDKLVDWESDLVIDDEGEDWEWMAGEEESKKAKYNYEPIPPYREPEKTKTKSISTLVTILLAGGGVLVAGLATVGLASYVKSRKKSVSIYEEKEAEPKVEAVKPVEAPAPEPPSPSPTKAPVAEPIPMWGYNFRPRPLYYRRGVG